MKNSTLTSCKTPYLNNYRGRYFLITIQTKVDRLTKIAEGVIEVTLIAENEELLPGYTPGAHVDLFLPNGVTRAYSLTDSSFNRTMRQYVIAVGLSPTSRGGSDYVHHKLKVGDSLMIGKPRNLFELVESLDPVLLIAGGIGVTPLRAMALDLTRQRRTWRMAYAAKSRSHAAYVKELAALSDSVHFHFDDEHDGCQILIDEVLRDISAQTHIYCCGPQGMMKRVRECTSAHPIDHLHFESFGTTAELQPIAGRAFSVVLAREGKTIEIAKDQSILDALEANGFVVPSVCREGVCGSCECTVLEGDIDHRDVILSQDEKAANQTMMLCVSRARGNRLVLDL